MFPNMTRICRADQWTNAQGLRIVTNQELSPNPENEEWLSQQLAIHGTATAVADHWGLGERTLQRRAKRLRQKQQSGALAQVPTYFTSTDLMSEIHIDGSGDNRGVLTADWHIPVFDAQMGQSLIEHAIEHRATNWLVVAGDFFNFDALSKYSPKQDTAGLELELQMASLIVERLLDVFDNIYFTWGNHDERLVAALGFKMKFEAAITMALSIPKDKLSKVHVTGRDYVIVETGNGPWRVCHTKQYAKAPLAVPNRLADKYRMAVAGGHRHHLAAGTSVSGYPILELGGLHDSSRTEYLEKSSTDFPVWQTGFWILADGIPYCPQLAPVPQ